jgi:hypothetical protein
MGLGGMAIKANPASDPLHSDPLFQDLLRRMGLHNPSGVLDDFGRPCPLKPSCAAEAGGFVRSS